MKYFITAFDMSDFTEKVLNNKKSVIDFNQVNRLKIIVFSAFTDRLPVIAKKAYKNQIYNDNYILLMNEFAGERFI